MNKHYLLAGCAIGSSTGHDAGRSLLRRLYQEFTGQGEMPPVRVSNSGKPYFEGDPVYFSISHTKRHAFCAVSIRPIGIDAEEKDRNIDLRLANKILSPAERSRFDAAEDQRTALLKLWVLKEAQVKFTGEGLRGWPNHTDFSPDDPRVREMDGCFVAVVE